MHEFDASFASWENFGSLNVEFAGQSQRGIIAAWNQIDAVCFHFEFDWELASCGLKKH